VPVVYESVEDIKEYPVFLKPEVGYGSRGVYIAKSKEQVLEFLFRNANYFISEFLPGKE
jgi:carbamoylphosphate synthase large subunit